MLLSLISLSENMIKIIENRHQNLTNCLIFLKILKRTSPDLLTTPPPLKRTTLFQLYTFVLKILCTIKFIY